MVANTSDSRILTALYYVMFDASPSESKLGELAAMRSEGKKLYDIANILKDDPAFLKVYPNYYTPEEFSAKLLDILVGSTLSPLDYNQAKYYVQDKLAHVGLGYAFVLAVTGILDTTNSGFMAAKARLNDKVDNIIKGFSNELKITDYSPSDNAHEVAIDSNVTIKFDHNVKLSDKGTIELYRMVGNTKIVTETYDLSKMPANLSVSGDTLTIDPTWKFINNQDYHVTISQGAITDTTGTYSNVATDAFNFHTVGDHTPPIVKSFTPGNNANYVLPNMSIEIKFSEDIKFGEKGTIEIREKSPTGKIVETFELGNPPGLVIIGDTLRIDPTWPLADNTKYYVVISKGAISDMSDNAFGGTKVNYDYQGASGGGYSFTTGSSHAPHLLGYTKNVSNDTLTLNFSKYVIPVGAPISVHQKPGYGGDWVTFSPAELNPSANGNKLTLHIGSLDHYDAINVLPFKDLGNLVVDNPQTLNLTVPFAEDMMAPSLVASPVVVNLPSFDGTQSKFLRLVSNEPLSLPIADNTTIGTLLGPGGLALPISASALSSFGVNITDIDLKNLVFDGQSYVLKLNPGVLTDLAGNDLVLPFNGYVFNTLTSDQLNQEQMVMAVAQAMDMASGTQNYSENLAWRLIKAAELGNDIYAYFNKDGTPINNFYTPTTADHVKYDSTFLNTIENIIWKMGPDQSTDAFSQIFQLVITHNSGVMHATIPADHSVPQIGIVAQTQQSSEHVI